MAGTLFIRLQQRGISWRVDEAGGASGASTRASSRVSEVGDDEHAAGDDSDADADTNTAPDLELAQAARHCRGRQVVLLVPVADAPLFRVKLPTRNRARLAQAIPFALEEQLSDDVDALHFAIGKPDADGNIGVAVVSRAQMDSWLAQLQRHDIRPQHIIPDVLTLPLSSGNWTGLLEPGQLLLRQGPQQGLMIDSNNLGMLLPMALEEAGDALPDHLHLLACDAPEADDAEPAGTDPLPPLELPVERQQCGGTPLHHLSAGFDRNTAIDLLQGSYSPSEQSHRIWRTWRVAAALAAVWLVVSLSETALENHRMAGRELALRQNITQIFRDTFPKETTIVDPRIQMQNNLNALSGGDAGGGEFLTLLSLTGTPLTADRSIKITTARFKQDRLDLELQLADLQKLDQLKVRLEKQGLQVKIRNARSREGKVEGRLEIRAAAG